MQFFFVLLISCFQLLPTEYLNRNNLYKYLNPPDSITWWEAGNCNIFTNKYETLYCSDTLKRIEHPIFNESNSYGSGYFDAGPLPISHYLVYRTKSGLITYIDKICELPKFIGNIDNLPEALFLANLYGYDFEPNMKYGSYCYKNGSYTINAFKITLPPDVLPTIYINSRGKEHLEKPKKALIQVHKDGTVFEIINTKKNKTRKLMDKDMYPSY
jgi:hypothetical protein